MCLSTLSILSFLSIQSIQSTTLLTSASLTEFLCTTFPLAAHLYGDLFLKIVINFESLNCNQLLNTFNYIFNQLWPPTCAEISSCVLQSKFVLHQKDWDASTWNTFGHFQKVNRMANEMIAHLNIFQMVAHLNIWPTCEQGTISRVPPHIQVLKLSSRFSAPQMSKPES